MIGFVGMRNSGSPVFVYKPPYAVGEDADTILGQNQMFLLGIEIGTRFRRDPVWRKKIPPPHEIDANLFLQSVTNISYVVPAWRLRTLLESDAEARRLFTEFAGELAAGIALFASGRLHRDGETAAEGRRKIFELEKRIPDVEKALKTRLHSEDA